MALNRWQKTIVDAQGNIVPGAILMIRRESDQALVTVYKDREGTQAYPMGQVTANSMGYAYFYAPADLYRITSATPAIDWRDVDIGAAVAQQIAQQALDSAMPTYETLLDMQADTGQPVDTMARVVNDLDPDNNGFYLWDGAAWNRTSLQPASDADVQDRLRKDQNLADLDDAATARTNLGLGSAAVEDSSNFALSATKVEGGDGLVGGGDLSANRIITLSGQTKYDLDQIYAQLRRAEYGDGPYPVFDQVFGANARFLDPRITFTRAGKSWRTVNGVLREYDVNEPCLTGDGWSVRPAETNLATPSGLSLDGVTLTASTIPLPVEGETSYGVRIQESAANSAHRLFVPYSPVPDGKVTAGFLVNTSELGGRNFAIAAASSASYGDAGVRAVFDAQGQYVGRFPAGGGDPGYSVTPLSASWLLVTRTGNKSGDTDNRFQIEIVDGLTEVFAGNGTSALHIGFPQFNVGDPIPPIPTTSGAVTRPADNASIQGDAFASVWNPMEGAIVWEFVRLPPYSTISSSLGVYGVNGGTDRIALVADWYSSTSDNRCGFQIITNGQEDPGLPRDLPALSVGDKHCMAISFDQTGVSCAIDGQIVGSDIPLSYGLPDVTRLSGVSAIGAYNSIPPEMHRRLTIFNRRPSDAMMEALTS